ncbi:MAG: AI-2E family transporter [Candidatus Acidiferrales bacterium]
MTSEITSEKRLGPVLFYGVVAVLGYFAFRIFLPFFAPLAWAGVVVVVFFSWHEKIEKRLGKTRAALTSTVAVTLILVVPIILVAGAFVREGLQMAQSVQQQLANNRFDWANHVWQSIQNRLSDEGPADLSSFLRERADRFAGFLATGLGVALRHVAGFFFDLFVMILAMFYLFRDGDDVMDRIRSLLPFEPEHRDRMLQEAHELIFASVLSSLATAVLHGAVGGVMFAILGINAPLFWGVMMAFFSLLPVVGSALIWAPAAIWLIAQGHATRGIVLIVVCAGVVAAVENIIRPWLISGRAQISGLVIFISVLGGIGVFGVLGIILGPIIVATTAGVLDLYTHPEPKRHARVQSR